MLSFMAASDPRSVPGRAAEGDPRPQRVGDRQRYAMQRELGGREGGERKELGKEDSPAVCVPRYQRILNMNPERSCSGGKGGSLQQGARLCSGNCQRGILGPLQSKAACLPLFIKPQLIHILFNQFC